MKRVCVYCGSREGARPDYRESARRVGRLLAGRGIGLVYGGMRAGLMGEVADAVLDGGGEVTGIIPEILAERGLGHPRITDLRIVASMTARKGMMAELADAFVVLPGGVGTMEEFFEIWSWATLGLHGKPCGLLNVEGYYARLIDFLDAAVAEGFLKEKNRALVLVDDSPERLLDRLAAFKARPIEEPSP